MITMRFSPAVLLLVMAVACTGSGIPADCPQPPPTVDFDRYGVTKLHVEVADTPATQQRGLMGRRHLAEDHGMLFLFHEPTTAAFWMKDTLIPLSIAFYDGHRRIVDVVGMNPCRTDPCRRYRASGSYVGAIEANRGYFARHDIGVGDPVYPRTEVTCQ